MAVSGDEMEALAARKWPEAVMRDERERERERLLCITRKKGAIRILVFGVNITNRCSIDNIVIETNHFIKNFTNVKFIGKKILVGILFFKYQRKIYR